MEYESYLSSIEEELSIDQDEIAGDLRNPTVETSTAHSDHAALLTNTLLINLTSSSTYSILLSLLSLTGDLPTSYLPSTETPGSVVLLGSSRSQSSAKNRSIRIEHREIVSANTGNRKMVLGLCEGLGRLVGREWREMLEEEAGKGREKR